MKSIPCSYNALIEIRDLRNLDLSYVQKNSNYIIFVVDHAAETTFFSDLAPTDSDYLNFEDNEKPTASQFSNFKDGVAKSIANYYWAGSSSKESLLVTQLVHRKNLTYQPDGFFFKTGNTSDYSSNISVSFDSQNNITEVKYQILSANGVDIQKAYVWVNSPEEKDKIESDIIMPDGTILGIFCTNIFLNSKINSYTIEAPTTTTLVQGLIIRMKYTSVSIAEKYVSGYFGIWK